MDRQSVSKSSFRKSVISAEGETGALAMQSGWLHKKSAQGFWQRRYFFTHNA